MLLPTNIITLPTNTLPTYKRGIFVGEICPPTRRFSASLTRRPSSGQSWWRGSGRRSGTCSSRTWRCRRTSTRRCLRPWRQNRWKTWRRSLSSKSLSKLSSHKIGSCGPNLSFIIFKYGPIPTSFWLFSSFLHRYWIKNGKSVHIVTWIWTWSFRMVCADGAMPAAQVEL